MNDYLKFDEEWDIWIVSKHLCTRHFFNYKEESYFMMEKMDNP